MRGSARPSTAGSSRTTHVGQRFVPRRRRARSPRATRRSTSRSPGARQPVHCAEPVARALGHRAVPARRPARLPHRLRQDRARHLVQRRGEPRLRGRALPRARVRRRHARVRVGGDRRQARTPAARAAWSTCARARSTRTRREVLTLGALGDGRASASPARAPPGRACACAARARCRPRSSPCPPFLRARRRSTRARPAARGCWDDYAPGEVIDHPGGMTLEEAEHMLRHAPLPEHRAHPLRRLPRARPTSSASASSTAAT